MIHILIEHDLINRDYIEQHTSGFEELRKSVETYTPEYVSEITGLSQELIHQTRFSTDKRKAAFIGWTMGVNHSTKGTETVNAINNLALITGNIGRAGASPFSITGPVQRDGNARGRLRLRLCPAIATSNRRRPRRARRSCGTLPRTGFPTARGLAYPDIIEAAARKKDSRAVDHRHQPDRLVLRTSTC